MTHGSLDFSLTVLSPVMLAAGPPAHNLLTTLDFIPGNTVRGLLAAQYLSQGSPEDSQFQEIFLDGQVFFGWATLEHSEPLPLSARSCKYESGFLAQNGHGLADELFPGPKGRCCAICGSPLDYLRGFWQPDKQQTVRVRKRTILRTAIDQMRGSASFGQLYASQVIEEGQRFFGSIEGPEPLLTVLADLLAEPLTAAIGRGRSRGQGWVEMRKADLPISALSNMEKRFHAFRAARSSSVLVLTLISDALFADKYLRDCGEPSIRDLAPLGIEPEQWQETPHRKWTAARTVFGFDGEPLHLPRNVRTAVQAGSVFLFEPKSETAAVRLPQNAGIGWIGERNSEGFGRAMLWHPFHICPEPDHG